MIPKRLRGQRLHAIMIDDNAGFPDDEKINDERAFLNIVDEFVNLPTDEKMMNEILNRRERTFRLYKDTIDSAGLDRDEEARKTD